MAIENELKLLAKDIAQAFFKDKNADLSELIAERAQQRKLNDEMIKRVIEMTNHLVRNEFYKLKDVNQASALFTPADFNKIMVIMKKEIKTPEGNVEVVVEKQASLLNKEASMNTKMPYIPDYYASPRQVVYGEIPKQASYNSYSTTIDRTEMLKKAAAEELKVLEHEQRQLSIEVNRSLLKAADAAKEFLAEMKNYLRVYKDQGGFDIVKMASTIDPEAFVGLNKYASELLPEDIKPKYKSILKLINTELPANFVIEDSPLVIKFKGYATARAEAMRKWRRLEDLEDTIDNLKEILTESFTPQKAQEKTAGLPGAIARAGKAVGSFFGRKALPAVGRAGMAGAKKTGGFLKDNLGNILITGAIIGSQAAMGGTEEDEARKIYNKALRGDEQASQQYMALLKQKHPEEFKSIMGELEMDPKQGVPKWVTKDPYYQRKKLKADVYELGTDKGRKYVTTTKPGWYIK